MRGLAGGGAGGERGAQAEVEGAQVEAAPGGNPSGGARRQVGWLLLQLNA